jgi:hypothetical protein
MLHVPEFYLLVHEQFISVLGADKRCYQSLRAEKTLAFRALLGDFAG